VSGVVGSLMITRAVNFLRPRIGKFVAKKRQIHGEFAVAIIAINIGQIYLLDAELKHHLYFQ